MDPRLEYILTKVPQSFGGKDNWLGYKMSPHTPMVFINEITAEGVKTNQGYYPWAMVATETIQTIYQRLKGNEAISNG